MKYNFLVLITSIIFMMSFSTYVFAEELIIKKPELSIGNNHLGTMIKSQAVSSDGSVWIFLTVTEPINGERMTVNVRFTDENGEQVNRINYDILVTQNDRDILSKKMVHQQMGIGDHLTQTLTSNDSVNVIITLQGIGVLPPFTGPIGESIQINVIPEFGTIAMMILVVSIVSIVAISAKSKLSLKL